MKDCSCGPPTDQPGSLIDHYVGRRLRDRRISNGVSIDTMAHALNVSAGNLLSWEAGSRRIPAGPLVAMSDLLSCRLTWFFEGFLGTAPFDEEGEATEHEVGMLFTRYSDLKH